MAKLDFKRRFAADRRFRDAVRGVQREAILRMAGLDPEALNEAWEDGVRPFTLERYEAWFDEQGEADGDGGGPEDDDDDDGDVRATAAAESLADEHGIDISDVDGSGHGGRVTKGDVEALIGD